MTRPAPMMSISVCGPQQLAQLGEVIALGQRRDAERALAGALGTVAALFEGVCCDGATAVAAFLHSPSV
jgi:hypothetical protein